MSSELDTFARGVTIGCAALNRSSIIASDRGAMDSNPSPSAAIGLAKRRWGLSPTGDHAPRGLQSPAEGSATRFTRLNAAIAFSAALAILVALFQLHSQYSGVRIDNTQVAGTPITIYRPASGGAAPVVVLAHGFAGSGRLMQSYALTLARNGYIAATFDFPRPWTQRPAAYRRHH